MEGAASLPAFSSLSLLSQAAACAPPAPLDPLPVQTPSNVANGGQMLGLGSAAKPRRLSSTSISRRRQSDAKDAAARPMPIVAPALARSLSPPTKSFSLISKSAPLDSALHIITASGRVTTKAPSVISEDADDEPSNGGTGRKKGITYKCECCSKVYRHPSCLVKHRWEHSPHWTQASKFLLSKHQQVQLLEGATILSHFGSSLPEDRSLWPAFTSGGLLPLPNGQGISMSGSAKSANLAKASPAYKSPDNGPSGGGAYASRTRSASSTEPRRRYVEMDEEEDYDIDAKSARKSAAVAIPAKDGAKPRSRGRTPQLLNGFSPPPGAQITQIRPGLLGHPNTPPSAATLPMRNGIPERSAARDIPTGRQSQARSDHHGRKSSADLYSHSYNSSSAYGPGSLSVSSSGGWSLPKSSVRGSSEEDDELPLSDDEAMNVEDVRSAKEEEDEWDAVMDMEL